jgi:NAD(P)-dependent dehydrogenase (short-subunit alcohol dehydrogenase family)
MAILNKIIRVMKISQYLEKLEDMTNKKVIVTGGTSGIGLSLVKHLLSKHAKVVVMARNMKKAEEVKNQLLEIHPDNPLEFIQYDQSDKDSIVKACDEIIKNHQDFYALVLNAGLIQSGKVATFVNEVPQTINTNFVGVSTIIDHLIYRLEGEHRIIVQGSVAAGLHIKKLKTLKDNNPKTLRTYFISKAGVEALFYYHSKKDYPNISFYLVEPGVTNSEIIRDFPPLIRKLGHPFLKAVSHSPDKAALTAMMAMQSTTNPNSFIIPRGFLSFMGYPKFRKFPHRRERQYLIDLLD